LFKISPFSATWGLYAAGFGEPESGCTLIFCVFLVWGMWAPLVTSLAHANHLNSRRSPALPSVTATSSVSSRVWFWLWIGIFYFVSISLIIVVCSFSGPGFLVSPGSSGTLLVGTAMYLVVLARWIRARKGAEKAVSAHRPEPV